MKPITRDDIARAVHAPSHVDYTVSTYEAAQADRVLALLREHGRECRFSPDEYEPAGSLNGYLAEADSHYGQPDWRRVLVIELEDDQ